MLEFQTEKLLILRHTHKIKHNFLLQHFVTYEFKYTPLWWQFYVFSISLK